MANINLLGIRDDISHGAPYGNAWRKRFPLELDATGAPVRAENPAPVAADDVIRIGWLPGGIELHDALMIVSTAFVGGTAKIGFAYVDGVDDAKVPQDDDYFHAALPLDAAGRIRAANTAVAPVKIPKDAFVIATISAAQTAVGRLDVIVEGLNDGYQ